MKQPKLLSRIWAINGLKNAIPNQRDQRLAQGLATYDEGFPLITMTPVAQGGKAPSGKDMNGILHELSAHIVHLNKGGIYKFDVTFTGQINGYSKGAILLNNDETAIFISLVDQNRTDFNTANDYSRHWAKLADIQSIKQIAQNKQEIAGVKNSKVDKSAISNAVNSTSQTNVANSQAVKTAYDKAVAAENLARGKQSPATTLAGYGIADSIRVDNSYFNTSLDGFFHTNTVWSLQGQNRQQVGLSPEMYNFGVGATLSSRAATVSLYAPHKTDHPELWLKSHYNSSAYQPSPWERVLMSRDIKVLTGTVGNGSTLPIPSGFSEEECEFFISMRRSVSLNRLTDSNRYYAVYDYYLEGRRVIAKTYSHNGSNTEPDTGRKYDNATVNYLVIGVKK